MAINQEVIVRDLALSTVEKVNNFMNALMALRDLQEWRDEAAFDSGSSAIDFTDYESSNDDGNSEIIGENALHDNLKHLDGSMLNKLLGQVLGGNDTDTDSVSHHLENTLVSGGPYNGVSFWEIIQMVRQAK